MERPNRLFEKFLAIHATPETLGKIDFQGRQMSILTSTDQVELIKFLISTKKRLEMAVYYNDNTILTPILFGGKNLPPTVLVTDAHLIQGYDLISPDSITLPLENASYYCWVSDVTVSKRSYLQIGISYNEFMQNIADLENKTISFIATRDMYKLNRH